MLAALATGCGNAAADPRIECVDGRYPGAAGRPLYHRPGDADRARCPRQGLRAGGPAQHAGRPAEFPVPGLPRPSLQHDPGGSRLQPVHAQGVRAGAQHGARRFAFDPRAQRVRWRRCPRPAAGISRLRRRPHRAGRRHQPHGPPVQSRRGAGSRRQVEVRRNQRALQVRLRRQSAEQRDGRAPLQIAPSRDHERRLPRHPLVGRADLPRGCAAMARLCARPAAGRRSGPAPPAGKIDRVVAEAGRYRSHRAEHAGLARQRRERQDRFRHVGDLHHPRLPLGARSGRRPLAADLSHQPDRPGAPARRAMATRTLARRTADAGSTAATSSPGS